jgi:hypothetical protein
MTEAVARDGSDGYGLHHYVFVMVVIGVGKIEYWRIIAVVIVSGGGGKSGGAVKRSRHRVLVIVVGRVVTVGRRRGSEKGRRPGPGTVDSVEEFV